MSAHISEFGKTKIYISRSGGELLSCVAHQGMLAHALEGIPHDAFEVFPPSPVDVARMAEKMKISKSHWFFQWEKEPIIFESHVDCWWHAKH